MRVLRPGGVAETEDKRIVKPAPEGLDDWSHPYHGPDNNPLSEDRIIMPYLTQFLAEPYYGPLPQVAVASAGQIFRRSGTSRSRCGRAVSEYPGSVQRV